MKRIEQAISSIEVAEMVGKSHDKLLRDIRRYIEQLSLTKIGESDFFTESTYKNERGKEYPSYNVTKKGCEFIAHKLTGTKGTIFTARYINRFHEMEDGIQQKIQHDIPVGEVARLSTVMDRVMVRQNSKPHDIARAFEMLCKQFGIALPANFVNIPEYEQLTLNCVSRMGKGA